MDLVIATRNSGKIKEIKALLAQRDFCVHSLAEFPNLKEVEEDGETFAANALKKARAAAVFSGMPALADDSGLCVAALQGRPGVHSARYAGEGASDDENVSRLLTELAPYPAPRHAAFECVMAFCTPDGKEQLFHGRLAGRIIAERRGANGFGYDPVFLVPEYGKTLAELPLDIKNRISHRAQALRKVIAWLQAL